MTLYNVTMCGLKVIKTMLIKTLDSESIWRWPSSSCDGSHWADCSRHAVLRRRRGRPLLNIMLPVRWYRPMTRSTDDAVIPNSQLGRWRSAGSLVWTHVRTGRPVRTACTGCTKACATSGGPQGVGWCGRSTECQLSGMWQHWWWTADGPGGSLASWWQQCCSSPILTPWSWRWASTLLTVEPIVWCYESVTGCWSTCTRAL